jgi:hypothetical protein
MLIMMLQESAQVLSFLSKAEIETGLFGDTGGAIVRAVNMLMNSDDSASVLFKQKLIKFFHENCPGVINESANAPAASTPTPAAPKTAEQKENDLFADILGAAERHIM